MKVDHIPNISEIHAKMAKLEQDGQKRDVTIEDLKEKVKKIEEKPVNG